MFWIKWCIFRGMYGNFICTALFHCLKLLNRKRIWDLQWQEIKEEVVPPFRVPSHPDFLFFLFYVRLCVRQTSSFHIFIFQHKHGNVYFVIAVLGGEFFATVYFHELHIFGWHVPEMGRPPSPGHFSTLSSKSNKPPHII